MVGESRAEQSRSRKVSVWFVFRLSELLTVMKTRRRNYSEDRLTFNLRRRIKRAKKSEKEGENALPIPIDLVFEIFSRLPVKSIARCRCVSKIWASMLSRREFTELFLSKSNARPQLLFVCENGRELLVFSSPQPQNPDENSPPMIANYHMSFSFDGYCRINGDVNGLVCVIKDKRLSNGWYETVPMICNPSTGEFLPLKKVNTRRSVGRSLFGYDPIDQGFKILSMTWGPKMVEEEHQVLTLGTDKWRTVEHCIPSRHCSLNKGLCINGVLYYQTTDLSAGIDAICCFDINSEKFSFIKVNETMRYSTLINYSGNLGVILSGSGCFDQRCTSLKLWVLKDGERQEWSKRNLMLPPLWKCVVGKNNLSVVGVIGTNEIVFQAYRPAYHSHPLCLFYFNTDKNTIVRVEIQGFGRYNGGIRVFMNHVEDVKLI